MQTASEMRLFRSPSAFAIAAAAVVAACGGIDPPSSASAPGGCTIALSASTDEAHLQAAIESALRRQDPCSLADPQLRAPAARATGTGADVRSSYELVRVERDTESVRAVFQAVPETRLVKDGE
jgi:hypothetical protein